MSDASTPTIVLSWTIPSPKGLWYQAFVFVDRGVFLTDRIDITTLKRIQKATAGGTASTVKELTDHGRFNRPVFTPFEELKGLRVNTTGGTVELQTSGDTLKATVPNRDRLQLMSEEFRTALATFVKQTA